MSPNGNNLQFLKSSFLWVDKFTCFDSNVEDDSLLKNFSIVSYSVDILEFNMVCFTTVENQIQLSAILDITIRKHIVVSPHMLLVAVSLHVDLETTPTHQNLHMHTH